MDGIVENRSLFDPLTQLLLPELVLPALIAAGLPRGVKLAASVVLLGSLLHTFTMSSTGDKVNDYSIGSAVLGVTFFNIMLLIWLTDPMKDFRYALDRDPSRLADRSFTSRFYNAMCIVRNCRLIGWNVQTANVPPAWTGTRAGFLLHRFSQLLWSYVLADLMESYIYSFFHLYPPGPADPALKKGVVGFLVRSWGLFAWLAMTYAILKMSVEVVSIIVVALGLSRPEHWPDAFGKWSDAYTIRHLWGRTWHQNLRRHFSYWGKLVVRTLHIQRGTWLSSQTQIWTAFFLSAVLHSFGDIMMGRHFFGKSFPFFLLNALAITIEDAAIALGKACGFGVRADGGPTRAAKIVGYAWVVLCVRFTVPFYVDWMFESSVTNSPVLPFSPTMKLVVPFISSRLFGSKLS